ncbi:MAG: hypothetical protein RRB13_02080 [bacterium]|nr:hypothetical protein [bacterium]
MNLARYNFFYYAVLILAAVGILGALSMIPSEDEVAFLNFKDKNFKDALTRYEAQYAAGNRSPSLIGPLCDLYLQYGQVNAAITVLEDNLERLPDQLEVRRRLAKYYQYAQRPADYLINLEALSRLKPDREILRQLAQIYNYNEQYDHQAETLRRIISEFEPTHEDYINLAYLYAAQGKIEEAYQVVLELFDQRFAQVEPAEIDFALSLMLDLNRRDEALKLALRVIQGKWVGQLERITNLFQQKGASSIAFKLLEPFEAQENLPQGILLALVSIQISQNRQEVALERLRQRFDQRNLPVALVETYLELILEFSDAEELSRFIAQANLTLLDESHHFLIAKRLVRTGKFGDARILKQRLSKEYLEENWLVSAVLEVVSDGYDSAATQLAISRNRNLEDWRRLFLARVYHELDLPELSKDLLIQVRKLSSVRHLSMNEVTEMYLYHDLTPLAYQLLNQEKKRVAGQELSYQLPVLYAWMSILGAMGRSEEILAELRQIENPPADLFRQLYFIGVRFQQHPLALDAARSFEALEKSPEATGYLANALALNEQYEEAMPLLSGLYVSNPVEWMDPYAKGLWALGRRQEWLDLWLNELNQPGVTDPRRVQIAFNLLDKNYKQEAEAIFLTQAQNQGPTGPAVQQLLFLWGLRPEPGQIEWLQRRADAASGTEQAGWYRRLVEVGEGARLAELVEANQPWSNQPLIDLYLEYLGNQRDRTDFYRQLSKAIELETNLERLKKLARMAGNQPLAEAAFKKLLAALPSDKEASAQRGITAFLQGKFSSAEGYLSDAIDQGIVDAEVYYYYGQLLLRKDDPKGKDWLRQAMALFEVSGKTGIEVQLFRAQILWDLGERKQCIAIYRQLIQAYPLEIGLKADLANRLIEMGRIGEAEELIGGK